MTTTQPSTKGLHSYPSIYALGHAALTGLFDDPVVVEEKLDGSQFSWGVIDGELRCRSKGAKIEVSEPEGMFKLAVETALRLAPDLQPGWTYRGEYLQKPKHNTLAYSRVPAHHIILFDVNPGLEEYLEPTAKQAEAARLGLEVVPVFHHGPVTDFETFKALAHRESCLGGVEAEGVVVKSLTRFGLDKKALMGKYVREAFKEQHQVQWKADNPGKQDVVQALIESLRTEARWAKAVQHLRDAGALLNAPQDIGPLMREVPADVKKECADLIRDKLFEWAWPQIQRAVTRGLPEWYKSTLAMSMFANPEE